MKQSYFRKQAAGPPSGNLQRYLPFLDYIGNIGIYITKAVSTDLLLRCKTETEDRNPLSVFEHVSTAEQVENVSDSGRSQKELPTYFGGWKT